MSDVLPEKILKVISNYLPVLERMSARKRNDLISGILQMQKYGVEAFSNRIIYPSGYSSIFCTSLNWKKMNRDETFQKELMNHVSFETVNLFKSKSGIVSRSSDKIYNSFLTKLENGGVNNGLNINEFHKRVIEVTYFTANPARPQDRDLILNNLGLLSFIKKNMEPALKEIYLSKEFEANKELLLNVPAIEFIWNKSGNFQKKININILGKDVNLSHREIECLLFLRFGSSNKFIADRLKISVETVKHHLSNLKLKLSVSERKDLIEIAQHVSIINITKNLSII